MQAELIHPSRCSLIGLIQAHSIAMLFILAAYYNQLLREDLRSGLILHCLYDNSCISTWSAVIAFPYEIGSLFWEVFAVSEIGNEMCV